MRELDGRSGLAGQLQSAVDKALALPGTTVQAHVARTRRSRPTGSPSEIVSALERQYLATVSTTGAATGAAAAAPGVGTAAAVALGSGDAVAFLTASTMHILAVSEIHGLPVEDLERRRTLLLAVLIGDSGSATVTKIAERTGQHWGRQIVQQIPLETIRQVNKVLGRNFVTRYGTRQGILVLGKAVPFGLGILLGAGGNATLGWMTVKATRRVFGPPPSAWPGSSPDETTPDDCCDTRQGSSVASPPMPATEIEGAQNG